MCAIGSAWDERGTGQLTARFYAGMWFERSEAGGCWGKAKDIAGSVEHRPLQQQRQQRAFLNQARANEQRYAQAGMLGDLAGRLFTIWRQEMSNLSTYRALASTARLLLPTSLPTPSFTRTTHPASCVLGEAIVQTLAQPRSSLWCRQVSVSRLVSLCPRQGAQRLALALPPQKPP